MKKGNFGRRPKRRNVKKKEDYSIKKTIYLAILGVLISFFTATMSISLAKYATTMASSDVARTANFIAKLNINNTEDIVFIPNSNETVEFNVTNFEGTAQNPTKINEVSLKYRFTLNLEQIIQNNNRIPLTITLYKVNNNNNIEELQEINVSNGLSDWIDLETIYTTTHNYRLVLSWPEDAGNNSIYANLREELSIGLEVEQKDVL